MPMTRSTATHLAARLQVIEAITNLILQDIPNTLGPDVIEGMSGPERRFFREKLALYRSIIAGLRARGGAASTADEITRSEISILYANAQDTMGHVGEATRKLRAFLATDIENAPTTPGQRATWEVAALSSLAAVDARVADFPQETP